MSFEVITDTELDRAIDVAEADLARALDAFAAGGSAADALDRARSMPKPRVLGLGHGVLIALACAAALALAMWPERPPDVVDAIQTMELAQPTVEPTGVADEEEDGAPSEPSATPSWPPAPSVPRSVQAPSVPGDAASAHPQPVAVVAPVVEVPPRTLGLLWGSKLPASYEVESFVVRIDGVEQHADPAQSAQIQKPGILTLRVGAREAMARLTELPDGDHRMTVEAKLRRQRGSERDIVLRSERDFTMGSGLPNHMMVVLEVDDGEPSVTYLPTTHPWLADPDAPPPGKQTLRFGRPPIIAPN